MDKQRALKRKVNAMVRFKAVGVWTALAMACATALAPSAVYAQANCDWYASEAIKQQQRNEKAKCGFSGTGWSSDKKSHLSWCTSASPDQWKRAVQQREQDLASCAGK